MRLKSVMLLLGLGCLFCFSGTSFSQNAINTGLNHTTIDLPCGQTCLTAPLRLPDVRTTDSYVINTIDYTPNAYRTSWGNELTALYDDDRYSAEIPLPFTFCFYGKNYTSLVIGSNGLLTFDAATNASCANGYRTTQLIPYAGGTPCNQDILYYPRAAVMAAYSDLDPSPASSPADKKIEWRMEGVAPARKLIASYYRIGVYGNPSCNNTALNTFQIVLYESTGVIELFFERKACASNTNSGRAIMGLQNWERNLAIPAPGKNSTVWNEANTAYRFTPFGSAPLFVSSSVLDMSGALVSNGSATPGTPGFLDVTFSNVCPSATSQQFQVKTIYSVCDNPANFITIVDTITVNRSTLNATASMTQASCGGGPGGTITATVPPASAGAGPFTYTLDGGTPVTGQPASYTFNGVPAGPHTVVVSDALGTCVSTIDITVTSSGTLNATASSAPTNCVGASNGQITVDVPVATAPLTYTLIPQADPSATVVQVDNNVFTGLAPGNYTVNVVDAGGCQASVPVSVAAGPQIIVETVVVPSSCPGANNGSLTVNTPNATPTVRYRLNFGPWQNTNVFSGLAAGTYYLDVEDGAGCTASFIPVNVTEGGTVTGTATATPTSCTGVNNGSVTVTPTNGTGPYLYSIDGGPWLTNNIFNSLSPATYTFLIQENGICTSAPITATVAAGAGLTATATPTGTTCAGVDNGSIQVNVTSSNGTAPYTYTLDGGTPVTGQPATYTFTDLAAGSHSITIQDANGCTTAAAVNATVAAGAGLTATATPTGTTCAGANNGSIQVNVTSSNGTAPYTYTLDGGTPVTGQPATYTFTDLAAGSHSITIQDANGCTTATAINATVTSGAGLTATATATGTSCSGVNNGTIQVNVTSSNGTAPYTYILDGGTPVTGQPATYTFTDLAAGSHSITIQDANGCVTAPAITATVPTGSGFAAVITSAATTCAGVNNGSIGVRVEPPGTAPYTFTLNPSGTVITGTIATFTDLAPGNDYSITVVDNNGCEYMSGNITVAQGAGLVAQANPKSTTCAGVNNGEIEVTTNGTAPFTYVLDGSTTFTGQSSPYVFTGLAAGNHTISVTDANGCVTVNPVGAVVATGAGFTATHAVTNASCAAATDGGIEIRIANPGIAPYTFTLNGSVSVNDPAVAVFTGLSASTGNSVVITDAVGCTFRIDNITVTAPTVLTVSAATQPVACNGSANGVITATVAGGSSGYNYSLNNVDWQASSTFNVAAGSYTVYVRDANGCTAQANNVAVTEPAVLAANITSTSPATCNGGNNGQITVTASGGTAPYTYSSDNGANFQSGNVLNVGPGTYTVVVRDANNCTIAISDVVVGLNDDLTYSPMADPAPICEGSPVQLSITSNATSFAWTPAATLSNAAIANPVAKPAITTDYTVVMTLGRCTRTDDVRVTVWPAPIPNAGPDGEICLGQDFQLNGTGGVSYTWTPAANLSNASDPAPRVIRPTSTITYSLNVTDANGCRSLVADQVTVYVIPPFTVLTFPSDTVVHDNVRVPLRALAYDSSPGWNPGDIQYTWSPATGLDNPTIANPVATSSFIGDEIIYRVTAATAAGCEGEGSVRIKVYKGPDLYVATAFTPNNDGRNDVFFPFPVGIRSLNYFRVYNRAGQLVFNTSALNKGWDGKWNGVEQPTGVYVWMVEGVTVDGQKITRKGTVTLIR